MTSPVTQPQTASARTVPSALVALVGVAAVVLGGAVLMTLISAIGFTGVLLLGGVLGSFGFVVLTVSRRRPVSGD
ncbi:MAG TPA: hypothetical protein VMZ00_08030 [Sporichthya sp.]|nr:hypothetical protein [Sporichthya sp.]